MTIFKIDRDIAANIAAACRMDSEYDPVEDIAEYRRELTRDIAETLRGDPMLMAAQDLFDALSWFINDIDETHTVMVDFDANVERSRAALAKAKGNV